MILNRKPISTPAYQQLEVNKSARIERHKRVFEKASYLQLPKFNLFQASASKGSQAIKSVISPYPHHGKKGIMDDTEASNTLFKRYTAMVAVIFLIGSLTPLGTTAEGMYVGDYGGYYVDSTAFASGIVADEEGYLTKVNPQTNRGDRSNMTDRFVHTVASGETLSTIAEDYDLKTSTLLWENNIGNANSLKVGQKLVIPPVDGVTHKVSGGESIEKIAEEYKVEEEAIRNQNNILVADVNTGDEVFVPGAKPLVQETRTTPARVGTASRVNAGNPVSLENSYSAPVGEKPFIMPTRGVLTQGFHAGHYAYDIADASMPPVWAAGTGKVITASSGTWGGGYGNHVKIDHGNGLQTLYAHLDYLTVGVGDVVDRGEVVGRMGKTGRVYGRTGIHLHFEVILNGVRQVPSNYY